MFESARRFPLSGLLRRTVIEKASNLVSLGCLNFVQEDSWGSIYLSFCGANLFSIPKGRQSKCRSGKIVSDSKATLFLCTWTIRWKSGWMNWTLWIEFDEDRTRVSFCTRLLSMSWAHRVNPWTDVPRVCFWISARVWKQPHSANYSEVRSLQNVKTRLDLQWWSVILSALRGFFYLEQHTMDEHKGTMRWKQHSRRHPHNPLSWLYARNGNNKPPILVAIWNILSPLLAWRASDFFISSRNQVPIEPLMQIAPCWQGRVQETFKQRRNFRPQNSLPVFSLVKIGRNKEMYN